MNNSNLVSGDRVLVDWLNHEERLPGTFVCYTEHEPNESFKRLVVRMDNGYACHGSGFHPDCVHKAEVEPKPLAYTLSNCGSGSDKYGNCEVCRKHADTIYLLTEYERHYSEIKGSDILCHKNTKFGHKNCLSEHTQKAL